jgi:hypothetical protein
MYLDRYPGRTGVDVLICTAIHTLGAGASKPWSQGALLYLTRSVELLCRCSSDACKLLLITDTVLHNDHHVQQVFAELLRDYHSNICSNLFIL